MDEVVTACSAIVILCGILKKKRRNRRKIWMKTWLANRDVNSAYNSIMQELRLNDRENFRMYLRMNTETFDELVRLVKPIIEKTNTP